MATGAQVTDAAAVRHHRHPSATYAKTQSGHRNGHSTRRNLLVHGLPNRGRLSSTAVPAANCRHRVVLRRWRQQHSRDTHVASSARRASRTIPVMTWWDMADGTQLVNTRTSPRSLLSRWPLDPRSGRSPALTPPTWVCTDVTDSHRTRRSTLTRPSPRRQYTTSVFTMRIRRHYTIRGRLPPGHSRWRRRMSTMTGGSTGQRWSAPIVTRHIPLTAWRDYNRIWLIVRHHRCFRCGTRQGTMPQTVSLPRVPCMCSGTATRRRVHCAAIEFKTPRRIAGHPFRVHHATLMPRHRYLRANIIQTVPNCLDRGRLCGATLSQIMQIYRSLLTWRMRRYCRWRIRLGNWETSCARWGFTPPTTRGSKIWRMGTVYAAATVCRPPSSPTGRTRPAAWGHGQRRTPVAVIHQKVSLTTVKCKTTYGCLFHNYILYIGFVHIWKYIIYFADMLMQYTAMILSWKIIWLFLVI